MDDVESTIKGFAERTDDQDTVALAERLTTGDHVSQAAAFIKAATTGLNDSDKKVQSGCIKLLYEIGYRSPDLIADKAGLFLGLLKSRNNRLAWGSMIALSTIASLCPEELFEHREEILRAVEKGSTITQDRGIMTLGIVAGSGEKFRKGLFGRLLEFLAACDKKDFPKFCEHIFAAVDSSNAPKYANILESRKSELPRSGCARVERLLKKVSRLE